MRPRERAERTELRSFSPTRERSMPPPWIRSRGRKTSGLGPDSNSCSPPKRDGEEDEEEAAWAVGGGGASPRISEAPPAAAGDHERERRRRLPDPGGD
jgi:hypothetical protein